MVRTAHAMGVRRAGPVYAILGSNPAVRHILPTVPTCVTRHAPARMKSCASIRACCGLDCSTKCLAQPSYRAMRGIPPPDAGGWRGRRTDERRNGRLSRTAGAGPPWRPRRPSAWTAARTVHCRGRVHRRRRYGAGASRSKNATSASRAVIPAPAKRQSSSTTTTRCSLPTEACSVARSNGRRLHRSITSAATPPRSSSYAAANATSIMRDQAIRVTSAPARRTAA